MYNKCPVTKKPLQVKGRMYKSSLQATHIIILKKMHFLKISIKMLC